MRATFIFHSDSDNTPRTDTMKRSLNEMAEIGQATGRDTHSEDHADDRARKLMRSHSRRGSAAMTLIALAVSEYQRRSSEVSTTNPPMVVDNIPVDHCRSERTATCVKPLPTVPTSSPRRGSYKEFVFECGALQDDWKVLCRPLPLPPQLPSYPMSTRGQ